MALRTPEVTLSYPHLFKARPTNKKPNAPLKFSAALLFTHEAMKSPKFKEMEDAAKDGGKDAFGSKSVNILASPTGSGPIKTFRQDVAAKGYDPKVYGCYINVGSDIDHQPEVIGRDGAKLTAADIYPGAKAVVSLGVYPYDTDGNRGVSFGLRNVCKTNNGPRLDNSRPASEEFADDLPPEVADDISDLE